MVCNADGSNATVLIDGAFLGGGGFFFSQHYPSWSPNGSTLVFRAVDQATGTSVLQLIDVVVSGGQVSGVNHRNLLESVNGQWSPVPGTSPAWSPWQHLIAYTRSGGIFVLDLNTGQSTQIVASGSSPAWSPDGVRIAYASQNTIRIKQVTDTTGALLESGDDSHLVTTYGTPLQLDWSRSGRFLAYRIDGEWDDPNVGIYVLDVQNLTYQILPNTSCSAASPAWPPSDGELVFMNRGADGCSGDRRIVQRNLSTQDQTTLLKINNTSLMNPDRRRF